MLKNNFLISFLDLLNPSTFWDFLVLIIIGIGIFALLLFICSSFFYLQLILVFVSCILFIIFGAIGNKDSEAYQASVLLSTLALCISYGSDIAFDIEHSLNIRDIGFFEPKFEIYIEEKHKFWTVLGVTIACVIGVCFLPPVVIMWIGIILLVASTIGVLWGIFGH